MCARCAAQLCHRGLVGGGFATPAQSVQEQLAPLYEEHVPSSLPHITAAYLDLTQLE